MITPTESFIPLFERLVEEVNRRAGAASSHSFEIARAAARAHVEGSWGYILHTGDQISDGVSVLERGGSGLWQSFQTIEPIRPVQSVSSARGFVSIRAKVTCRAPPLVPASYSRPV